MHKVTESHKPKSTEIATKGFACIKDGDYETALELAKELEDLRYSAAFDLGAQAYAGLGHLDKAVATLERGVEQAPDCWINWQLLGNYRSDMGHYAAAAEAYQSALTCSGVWEDSIRLNQAVLLNRQAEYEQSLVCLNTLRDPNLSLQIAATRIVALRGLNRFNDALFLADDCLTKDQGEGDTEVLAFIAAQQGRMQLASGWATQEVRRSALEALETFEDHTQLFALIRDIDGLYSSSASYMDAVIHVEIPEDHPLSQEAIGYFITYHIVSETPEQALEWIREFERLNSSVKLEIEEIEILDERPDEPLGVYWRGERCYYMEEDEN